MPELSRFLGFSICMYFDDHPPPHFHAIYAGAEVEIGILPLTILHNWNFLESDQPPRRIEPLD
jgi:Domain of unknown function (DUF4160)